MDRILIDDLRVLTVIGALAHEREIAQPIRIDLSIGVDLHEAGRSDDLAATVHYGLVCERATELARDSKDILLERLAAKVADVVLEFDLVDEVEVTLTKLRPPIAEDVQSTAVRIVRTRKPKRQRHRWWRTLRSSRWAATSATASATCASR